MQPDGWVERNFFCFDPSVVTALYDASLVIGVLVIPKFLNASICHTFNLERWSSQQAT